MITADEARSLQQLAQSNRELLAQIGREIRIAASSGRSCTNVPLPKLHYSDHCGSPNDYPASTQELLNSLLGRGFIAQIMADTSAPTEVWLTVSW